MTLEEVMKITYLRVGKVGGQKGLLPEGKEVVWLLSTSYSWLLRCIGPARLPSVGAAPQQTGTQAHMQRLIWM